jgi:hypothetical protein
MDIGKNAMMPHKFIHKYDRTLSYSTSIDFPHCGLIATMEATNMENCQDEAFRFERRINKIAFIRFIVSNEIFYRNVHRFSHGIPETQESLDETGKTTLRRR